MGTKAQSAQWYWGRTPTALHLAQAKHQLLTQLLTA